MSRRPQPPPTPGSRPPEDPLVAVHRNSRRPPFGGRANRAARDRITSLLISCAAQEAESDDLIGTGDVIERVFKSGQRRSVSASTLSVFAATSTTHPGEIEFSTVFTR